MAIFDTGSNMMDFPSDFFKIIKPALLQKKKMYFVFETTDNKALKIGFDSNIYMWDNMNDSSLIVEGNNRISDVIWGSLFMNNFVLTFDVDSGNIGFSFNQA